MYPVRMQSGEMKKKPKGFCARAYTGHVNCDAATRLILSIRQVVYTVHTRHGIHTRFFVKSHCLTSYYYTIPCKGTERVLVDSLDK